MKKIMLIGIMACFAASCNDSSTVSSEIDTLGKNADTLLTRIENSQVIDSVKSKGGKLLDSVKSRVEN